MSFEFKTQNQDTFALVSRQVVSNFRFDLAFKQADEHLLPFIKQSNPKVSKLMAFSPSDPKQPGPCYYEPGYLITNPEGVKASISEYGGAGKDTLHVRKIKAGEWLVYKHIGGYDRIYASWDSAKAELVKSGRKMNCTIDSMPFELYLNDMHSTPIDINQVSIRAPCCKKWFDCPECHEEQSIPPHKLKKAMELVMACKKCKKTFRKDMTEYDEVDEYCPHCDNHYVLDAKTPHMGIGVEGDDPRMMRDYRERQIQLIEEDLMADRLG
ncbi:hypothetical protein HDV01_001154 [Terramyces sp. JEL0728]|nr:hypothetical protein HDV01_001154 [Terramyces sp. JEL0728]